MYCSCSVPRKLAFFQKKKKFPLADLLHPIIFSKSLLSQPTPSPHIFMTKPPKKKKKKREEKEEEEENWPQMSLSGTFEQ
jgi:hypothetical protein